MPPWIPHADDRQPLITWTKFYDTIWHHLDIMSYEWVTVPCFLSNILHDDWSCAGCFACWYFQCSELFYINQCTVHIPQYRFEYKLPVRPLGVVKDLICITTVITVSRCADPPEGCRHTETQQSHRCSNNVLRNPRINHRVTHASQKWFSSK